MENRTNLSPYCNESNLEPFVFPTYCGRRVKVFLHIGSREQEITHECPFGTRAFIDSIRQLLVLVIPGSKRPHIFDLDDEAMNLSCQWAEYVN